MSRVERICRRSSTTHKSLVIQCGNVDDVMWWKKVDEESKKVESFFEKPEEWEIDERQWFWVWDMFNWLRWSEFSHERQSHSLFDCLSTLSVFIFRLNHSNDSTSNNNTIETFNRISIALLLVCWSYLTSEKSDRGGRRGERKTFENRKMNTKKRLSCSPHLFESVFSSLRRSNYRK